MNQKNLSVKRKTHKIIFNHLKNKNILKIFTEFNHSLSIKDKFAVAVSGGPDSLCLAFLAKCFSLKNNLEAKYFVVDHKLRDESSLEVRTVVKILKRIDIDCKILKWKGKKPSSNIQSIARDKRYSLLVSECKKQKIKHLLLGHHLDDLLENFFIRILRGSGLNGLISFNKNSKYKDNFTEILRPLLDLEKKDLIFLSQKVFNIFIKDPSNENEKFKRTRIRNILSLLKAEGLDKKKFLLTINNLKDSDSSIKFYVDRNIKNNSIFSKKYNNIILNKLFFDQSHEVVFRSLTKVIQSIGKKHYPVRGKSINRIIQIIKYGSYSKLTLGGCFIERINESILISKES
jgi:tRNA(Ile)-lysidine synthase